MCTAGHASDMRIATHVELKRLFFFFRSDILSITGITILRLDPPVHAIQMDTEPSLVSMYGTWQIS